MTDEYEYFADVWKGEVDHPRALWRRRGESMEYLSLINWSWHSADGTPSLVPHPDVLAPVRPDQVRALLGDRQRFAKYWVLYETSDAGETETRVFRQLSSPERLVEEVFGRDNAWIPTHAIRDFSFGGPHEVPDLMRIDSATAERLIQVSRGLSGATELWGSAGAEEGSAVQTHPSTVVRFTVERVFDLPGRDGLLVPGELAAGVVRGGMTLQAEDTGLPVRVLGVEFATPANEGTNKVTLRIDRKDASAITPGTTLTGRA